MLEWWFLNAMTHNKCIKTWWCEIQNQQPKILLNLENINHLDIGYCSSPNESLNPYSFPHTGSIKVYLVDGNRPISFTQIIEKWNYGIISLYIYIYTYICSILKSHNLPPPTLDPLCVPSCNCEGPWLSFNSRINYRKSLTLTWSAKICIKCTSWRWA